MDGLEYIVRPFTSPGPHGSVIIPATPRGTRERATLSWGHDAAITMPSAVEVNEGVNFEVVCCRENLNETERETEEIQIFNSVGNATYITVERPTSMKMKKKDTNHCLGPSLLETTDVAQAVNDSNEQWSAALHSGTLDSGKNCSVGWQFKNE